MDLADRAQEDEARAALQEQHLRLRQPLNPPPQPTHSECEDCGATLDKRRLAAVPTASRCVLCETIIESLKARGLA